MDVREEDNIPLLDVARVEDEHEPVLEELDLDEREEEEVEEDEEDDDDEEDEEEVDLTPEMKQLMFMMKVMNKQQRKRDEKQQRRQERLREQSLKEAERCHKRELKSILETVRPSSAAIRRMDTDEDITDCLVFFKGAMEDRGIKKMRWGQAIQSLLSKRYYHAMSSLTQEE